MLIFVRSRCRYRIYIRPRLDGGGAAAAAPADDGTVEEGLFKMKPTKAEKKAAAAVSNRRGGCTSTHGLYEYVRAVVSNYATTAGQQEHTDTSCNSFTIAF